MKIVVSRTELLAILTTALGREITDVTITKEPDFASEIATKLGRVLSVKNVTQASIGADKKIPAIKTMRELISGMGLAEAKTVVENWDQWIKVAKEKGRAPIIKGDYYSGFTFH